MGLRAAKYNNLALSTVWHGSLLKKKNKKVKLIQLSLKITLLKQSGKQVTAKL
jgi:hypothetical protein